MEKIKGIHWCMQLVVQNLKFAIRQNKDIFNIKDMLSSRR